jgi:hypothetical protein
LKARNNTKRRAKTCIMNVKTSLKAPIQKKEKKEVVLNFNLLRDEK